MVRLTLIPIFGMLIGIVLASSIWPKNRSPLIQFNARGIVRIIINRPEREE